MPPKGFCDCPPRMLHWCMNDLVEQNVANSAFQLRYDSNECAAVRSYCFVFANDEEDLIQN